MKTLIIMRGLPGAGKSTWIRQNFLGATPHKYAPIGWGVIVVSADHYFETLDGGYNFSPAKLGEAHTSCALSLFKRMQAGTEVLILDNTHCQKWEWALASVYAEHFGYDVEVMDVFDGGLSDEALAERGTHKVPIEVIRSMRTKWENI